MVTYSTVCTSLVSWWNVTKVKGQQYFNKYSLTKSTLIIFFFTNKSQNEMQNAGKNIEIYCRINYSCTHALCTVFKK